MDFAFIDVLTMETLTHNCRAIVFFDLTSIVIRCQSVEIHGVIKAAHSDPVGMQTNRVTRDYFVFVTPMWCCANTTSPVT